VEPALAERFIEEAPFYWHQRFELVPRLHPRDQRHRALAHDRRVPGRPVGPERARHRTANGGVCWAAEARGATRSLELMWDGELARFRRGPGVHRLLGRVPAGERLRAARVASGERFDIVVFFGVLYHLRHRCSRSTSCGRWRVRRSSSRRRCTTMRCKSVTSTFRLFASTLATNSTATGRTGSRRPRVRCWTGARLRIGCDPSRGMATPFGRTRWREAVHRLRTQEWMSVAGPPRPATQLGVLRRSCDGQGKGRSRASPRSRHGASGGLIPASTRLPD